MNISITDVNAIQARATDPNRKRSKTKEDWDKVLQAINALPPRRGRWKKIKLVK